MIIESGTPEELKAYILAWDPPLEYWLSALALYRNQGPQPWREHAQEHLQLWWDNVRAGHDARWTSARWNELCSKMTRALNPAPQRN